MSEKDLSFSIRLREALNRADISQAELARRSGVSESSLSRYMKGDWRPSLGTLGKIAKALNTTVYEMIGDDWSGIDMSDAWDAPTKAPLPSNVTQLPVMDKVPLIGSIACGSPILAEENIEDYVDLPRHIRADYALSCRGDSMIGADIHDGDVVYIRQQPEVQSGQIAAVLIDDEATLKRVYRNGDTVILQPENPAYPPQVFSGEAAASLRILGLAVAFTHPLV